ncbi:TetR/AcrR family transcriptional regulator [Endozoicomonas sp. OPT23]|uniref:TetR/AcrR family transcriptional regulator n=1 Tax=Endozoicomonas sp. OPT23 TaxID=2072845 RepID=UPI001891ED6E|nr:TetR/AcrR family transcriptional regulator [Endozoicomonas sp. OPT23]
MSRQQKREQRESEIIQGTLQLLQEKSFLDLKMSEVAQVAECSMGAIYSHFSSKEDLLLGCALDIMRNQVIVLHKALEVPSEPLEQLLLATFCCIIWDEQQPANYALNQLAMNPCVWQRASSHRNNAMNQEIEKIDFLVQNIATKVLEHDSPAHASDDNTKSLYLGLISISHGYFMIRSSGYGEFTTIQNGSGVAEAQNLYLLSVKSYLAGWGLAETNSLDDLHSLYRSAESLVLAQISQTS